MDVQRTPMSNSNYIKAELCPEADVEFKADPTPANPQQGHIGGMDFKLSMGKHTMWTSRVRLLLNQKPWYIPRKLWHIMLRLVVVQWEQFQVGK